MDKLTKGQRTKIEQDLKMLHLSRKLAAIHCEVPLEFSLENSRLQIDGERAVKKFSEMGLKGMERFFARIYTC